MGHQWLLLIPLVAVVQAVVVRGVGLAGAAGSLMEAGEGRMMRRRRRGRGVGRQGLFLDPLAKRRPSNQYRRKGRRRASRL